MNILYELECLSFYMMNNPGKSPLNNKYFMEIFNKNYQLFLKINDDILMILKILSHQMTNKTLWKILYNQIIMEKSLKNHYFKLISSTFISGFLFIIIILFYKFFLKGSVLIILIINIIFLLYLYYKFYILKNEYTYKNQLLLLFLILNENQDYSHFNTKSYKIILDDYWQGIPMINIINKYFYTININTQENFIHWINETHYENHQKYLFKMKLLFVFIEQGLLSLFIGNGVWIMIINFQDLIIKIKT